MGEYESHKYRVEIEVPPVVPRRDSSTKWRTLVVKDSYSDVGDLADYLLSSMVLSGIPRELARNWAEKHLRCKQVTTTTVNGEPEDMPLGP